MKSMSLMNWSFIFNKKKPQTCKKKQGQKLSIKKTYVKVIESEDFKEKGNQQNNLITFSTNFLNVDPQ